MTFPHYFHIVGYRIHPHPVMELIAYSAGFQLYRRIRRTFPATAMPFEANLWILVGALFGALAGSKLLAFVESGADFWVHRFEPTYWMGGKTILGGLLGGWFGVEVAKTLAGVHHSTGDAFVFPLILGMAIGRIGCFLTGLDDHTYGIATRLPWGINFGDGISRHPTQLYDIVFLIVLGLALAFVRRRSLPNGRLFLFFMASYCGWRFAVEFLKPTWKPIGVSPIQIAGLCGLAFVIAKVMRFNRPVLVGGESYDPASPRA